MEIQLKVLYVEQPREVKYSGGSFKQQILVCETTGEYSKKVALNINPDKLDVSGYKDCIIDAKISPESKEYNGKWYTELRCFHIKKVSGQNNQAPKQDLTKSFTQPSCDPVSDFENQNSDKDDLPF
jgi:hypothetical protein